MKDLIFDEIQVGEEFGPYRHPLTQESVQKYRSAVESRYPWQIQESGKSIPIAPPTMLGNLSFRLLETHFTRQPGTIHAKQELEFFHPIRLDRQVISRGKILDKFLKRDKKWVVYEVHFYDETGLKLGRSEITEVLPREEGAKRWVEQNRPGHQGPH